MRPVLKVVAIGVIAALAITALAVTAAGRSKNGIAAKVNGQPIRESEIDQQLAQIKQQYPAMFQGADAAAQTVDYRRRLLDVLISQELLRQEAEKSGIAVTDQDVEQQIADLKKGFQSDKQFQDTLAKAGITLDKLKQQVRQQLLSQRLIEKLSANIKVTDAQIKAYYDKNKATFKELAAVHAAHILFDAKDKTLADKVLVQVKAGGDFAALAKKYSKDTATKAKGGDLGWPTTPYVQEFQAAADKLSAGQVSGLVKSPFGLHIIKLIQRRPERQKTLAEVKEQVRQTLLSQYQADAYQKHLEELRKKADIEIIDKSLRTDLPATVPSTAATSTK